jgi:DNA transformation protein
MSQSDFHDFVVQDLLSFLPIITSRRMFGGHAVYKDGIIFGLIISDTLYFKVDATNQKDFELKNSKPFTYSHKKNLKQITVNYWELPSDVMEDREELEKWIQKSVEVTVRSKQKKVLHTKNKHSDHQSSNSLRF